MDHTYTLKNLSVLTKVEFFSTSVEGELLSEGNTLNPICSNVKFRKELAECCRRQEIPYIKRDETGMFWCGISCDGLCVLAGPVAPYIMDDTEMHRFCRFYQITETEEIRITVLSWKEYLSLIKLLGQSLLGREYGDEELIAGNDISVGDLMELEGEKNRHILYDDFIEHRSHTYQEEKKISEYLQKGDYDMVRLWNHKLISDGEALTEDRRSHWYNMAVVAITLCTRAAIEGGLKPTEAYRVSGFYIQKLRPQEEISDIQYILDSALKDLTDRMQKKEARCSNYTEQFKDYVSSHYREKILVEDVSSAMGISRGYLSRLFKKETGITCQEYIVMLRVERAANMLKYSNETMAYISDYVNFPNQSYFGEKFKKYKKMTPREYREKYKPLEF